MKKSRLKPISEKRQIELGEWKLLEQSLRLLCGNRSELTRKRADWQTNWNVEGHHITGRNGKRLLDPFNVIMLTRKEHDDIGKWDKKELLSMIYDVRIEQGFKPIGGTK